jgi:uncharacterized phage protein (TIGR01671 family)
MNNDRFKFRAVVEVNYNDRNGDDKIVKLLLNNVAVYSSTTIGVIDEILIKAIRNTNLDAEERNLIYNYFVENNLCNDNEWFVLDAEVIEQCTGLRDKNEKLIYEGDIVNRHNKYTDDEDITLKIKWNDKSGKFITVDDDDDDDDDDDWVLSMADYEYTVLGNVNKNPELLNQN